MKLKKFIMSTIVALLGISLFAQTINHKVGYGNLEWGSSLENAKKIYKLKEFPNDANWSFMYEGLKDSVKIYEATNKKDSVVDTLYFFFNDNKLFMARDILKNSVKDYSALTKRYGPLETDPTGDYWNRTLDKDNYIIQSIRIYKSQAGNYVAQLYNRKLYSSASITPLAEKISTGIVDDLEKLSNKLIQDVGGKPTYAFLALTSDDGNALVENYVTDALTEAMFNTGKIKIVERSSIEKILTEQQFQDSALVNENTASEIGNLTGANYVCYGTVKDLGKQVTINVKVVEVSTAELCSMGRETVAKDEYLSGVGFEARKTGGIAKKGSSTNSIANKNFDITKSKWEVKQNRNEFDEYTTYTFICRTTTGQFLFVGYDKYDKSIYSLVRVGFYWSSNPDSVSSYDGQWGAIYDVKTESGDILKFDLSNSSNDNKWSYKTGWKKGNGDIIQITWTKNLNQKELLEIFGSNKILSIRNEKYQFVKHFETEYFWETLEANGITKEELFAAIDNEKF